MDSAVLSILQAEDRYTVTLETPRQGPLALAGTVWVAREHRQDILRIVDAVTALINRQAGSKSPYRGDVSAMADVCEVGSLEEFGQLMFRLFLPPLIQNAIQDQAGSLIISTNDSQIPWELLHDGQTFISLRESVTRRLMVSRWVAGATSIVSPEPTFLIISNPLGDLDEADKEADDLMSMLDSRGVAYDLLRGPRATYISVQQALMSGRYEVIHYTGHAVFDGEHPDRSALHLAGGRRLPASQIEGILKGKPLVFLNACSSARQGGAADDGGWEVRYTGPQVQGLASAFVAGGAAGYLGAQWPIFDASSREFATCFYRSLLDGNATGEALQEARFSVQANRPSDATWASFILYGSPDLRIAETSAEIVAKAQGLFNTGAWDEAQVLLDQVAKRGKPAPEADALAQHIAAARVEKERLARLYSDGLAAFGRGDWQQAADDLAEVVLAEGDHPEAPEKLLAARRQLELAALLSQARKQAGSRRWRAALESLERLQELDAAYPGLAQMLAEVQPKAAQANVASPRPLSLLGGIGAFAIVAAVALFALWRNFGLTPPATPTATATRAATATQAPPTAAPIVAATPSTAVATPTAAPPAATITQTPTPTRPAGWVRVDGLGGAIVRAIAVDEKAGLLYLGTWGGGVQRSKDGGQTWQGAATGVGNEHVWSLLIDPITSTILYAGTNGSGLFRSEDGGATWADAGKGIDSGYVYALAESVENGRARLWAGTGSGKVFYSDDNGRAWQATKSQPGAGFINAFYTIAPAPGRPGRIFAGTNTGLFLSSDGGASWSEMALRPATRKPDIRDIAGDPADARVVYAGAAGEGVYRSRDGGQTWTLANQGMDNVRVRAMAADPLDPQVLYVGTDGGRVFRSNNGGDKWEATNTGLAGRSVQALAAVPSRVYAGTFGDGIFASTDGGRNWLSMNGSLNILDAVGVVGDSASPEALLLAAYGKGIFYTANGGQSWVPRSSGLSTEDVLGLVPDPQRPTTIYAQATDGLFRSSDKGLTWQAINSGFSRERPLALAVAPSRPALLYASAADGYIYRSDTSGERWTRLDTRVTAAWVLALAVDPNNPEQVYAGANDGLYSSRDGGRTWRRAYDASIYSIAIEPKSGHIFAGTSGLGMVRSSDGGATWLRLDMEKTDVVSVAVLPGQGENKTPLLILAGTAGKGVFASRDGGDTWAVLEGAVAPFVQTVGIHPAAPHDILVGTTNGLYIRTLESVK